MNSDANDRTTDRRVSETYRSIATERPPAHLDREIMRMARKEGRTPYAAARAWMQPFGWAATIALCLAIVIQLTQLPRDAAVFDVPAPAEQKAIADSPETTESAERESGDRSQPQAGAPPAAPAKKQPADGWRGREKPAMAGKTATFRDEGARTDSSDAAPPVAPATGPAGAEPVPIRSLSHPDRAAVSRVVEDTAMEARSLAAGAAGASDPLCPAAVRESAARWHACIESLRESVAEDRLAQELAEFDAAYPDFLPETRSGR